MEKCLILKIYFASLKPILLTHNLWLHNCSTTHSSTLVVGVDLNLITPPTGLRVSVGSIYLCVLALC